MKNTIKSPMKKTTAFVAMLFCLTGAAHAATFSFATPSGAKDSSGENLMATATFQTFSDQNYVAVTLTNYSSPLISVGQALTGIAFDADTSGIHHSNDVDFTSASVIGGQEYVVNADGTFSPTKTITTTSTTYVTTTVKIGKKYKTVTTPVTTTTTSTVDVPEKAWYLGEGACTSDCSGADEGLSVFGEGQPHNSDLPLLTSYSGTNSSIAGNGPHNPFYLGPVTFALHTSFASTSNINISDVVFEFGTGPQCVTATSPIPEPETYAMLMAGLGLLGVVARRRKQQAA